MTANPSSLIASLPASVAPANVTLRAMTAADLAEVSRLGILSKASWGYAPELMQVFARELTFDEASLAGLVDAQAACRVDEVIGYFTIRQHPDGVTELEHLFVHPDHFREGMGSELLRAALASAADNGAQKLTVLADPNSAGFYERFGATRVGDHESSIAGRVIPVFEFVLESP